MKRPKTKKSNLIMPTDVRLNKKCEKAYSTGKINLSWPRNGILELLSIIIT